MNSPTVAGANVTGGERVFRSYFIDKRGDEALGSPAIMDTGARK
jgi:hypothetical protein